LNDSYVTRDQFVLTDDVSINLATIINKRRKTYNPQRRRMLQEVRANISYLVGEQNIMLIGDTIQPIKNERQIYSPANMILPAVNKDIAQATKTPPVFDIIPSGTDDDDKATAQAGTKLFNYIQRVNDKGLHRSDVVLWYDIIGIGWRKVYWDPNYTVKGINPGPVNENGEPNPGHIPSLPVGAPVMQGEVVIEPVPATQLIYDYREKKLERLDWIIHAKRQSATWVEDTFGPDVYEKLKGKFAENADSESSFETRIDSLFEKYKDLKYEDQRKSTSKMASNANVELASDKYIDYYEYWQKPTKTMPTGAYAIMLGDQLVYHTPYPADQYPHGELPFVHAAPISVGDATFGGISRISQARPLQREYNRLRSQVAENMDIMGNSVMFAPREAKLSYKTLSNGAGNYIEYDGRQPPSRDPGSPMNSQIFAYMTETRGLIESIFAFHEPTRGIAPRNIDSGTGIAILQNADIEQLGPMVEGFEIADERVVMQAISVGLSNYENGRMINIVGTDYEWTTFTLDQEQMRGKCNVVVRQRSSLPKDKESEAVTAVTIWQTGLFGDPGSPDIKEWVLNQMHLGGTEHLLQKNSKQRNFAHKEFISVENNLKNIKPSTEGMTDDEIAAELERILFVPVINPFDDDMVHLMVHNEWMMDNYWTYAGDPNPIKRKALEFLMMHITMHDQRVMQRQQAAMNQELYSEMLKKGKTPDQIVLSKMNFEQKETKK
jgi:hypothetical protein